MSLLKTGDQPPRGPNLLGKADMAAAHADGNRILSQLEHGATAPATSGAAHWRPGRWYWVAGGACLVALGVAVLAHDMASLGAPDSAAEPATTVARATATAPAPAPAPPAAPPATAQHAATIVNDASPPLPVVVAAPMAATTPRKAPAAMRQGATRPPASRPAPSAAGDSDVALLTAMVAHAHRQEGPAAPVRDVVLRTEEEETASLLRRCKQLGMIEGMLCRSRICSGRWDSDAACH